MIKRKRLLSIVIGAVMVSSVLAGCGSSGSGSNSDNITLNWETHRTDMAGTTLKALADEYHKANPNITIKIESEKDSDGVMKTKAAGGELPDVSSIVSTMQRTDYPKYYADISDLGFTKDNLNCYENAEVNGKLYGIPSSVNYTAVIYNKEAFKKVGITSIPKTMDEFYTDCDKLKAAGITPFASNYKDAWPLSPYSDGHSLAQEKTGDDNFDNSFETKNPFDDPNGLLYGFKFMRTMKDKGYLEKDLMSTSWDNSKKSLAQGTTAMTYLGSWLTPQLVQNGAKAEDIGMFPFPETKALIMGGDTCLAVAKTSKHLDAAKKFIKWLFTKDRYPKACGIASPLKDAKQDAPGLEELLSYKTPIIIVKPSSDKVAKIWKESEVNLQQELQEYMTTSTPDKVIQDVNSKFKAARSSAE